MAEENTNNTSTEAGTEEQGQPKSYTQAEVDELLQKETDRRVTAALKKAQAKEADRTREAQKLAAMNEQQKYEYELSQREKAIEEKERQLTLSENKNIASKILSEKGLSLELVDFVVSDSADDMDANIKKLDKAFKACVKAEVEKRLGGKAPEKAADLTPADTAKDFSKMSLAQMAELQRTDPERYAALKGK